MTTAAAVKATFQQLRVIDFSGISSSYALIGNPLSQLAQIVIISSTLDAPCILSTDGDTDMILIPPSTTIEINVSANKQGTGKLSFPKGMRFYIKETEAGSPTEGALGISLIYGVL